MSLDLHQVARQIEEMADQLQARGADWSAKLDAALTELGKADAARLERKRQDSKVTWLVPGLCEPLAERAPCPTLPPDFGVLSVDGSHIDVSRHSPARCYLVNIGKVVLRYGSQPDARLWNEAHLYASEDDLIIADPDAPINYQSIEGPLLGLKRAVAEVQALAELSQEMPEDLPTLALVDGSLVMWGLSGQAYPGYVRQRLLEEEFLPALDELRGVAQHRTLAVAAYVSMPRSTEVVNALRLAVCPYEPANCDTHCKQIKPGELPCDAVGGLLDRDLFARTLEPGERSALFVSQSSVVREHYGPHQVHFFYLHAGEEVARVEVPAWVAQEGSLLSLAHTLSYDQCRRGLGYPAAIAEAHEQAVVTAADHREFARLVEEALGHRRLSVYTSQKEFSKRVKWL